MRAKATLKKIKAYHTKTKSLTPDIDFTCLSVESVDFLLTAFDVVWEMMREANSVTGDSYGCLWYPNIHTEFESRMRRARL